MTLDTNQRLLRVLALVPSDSHLDPKWEPRASEGVVYPAAAGDLDAQQVSEDLETLADRGYLERIFVERLMICPSCESHAVNVHEACVTCSSSNLESIKSYFHFRCGFIGPEKAFVKDAGGMRCPKCKKYLVDLGTQYDSPGDYFECKNCAAMFQQPQMGVRCLSCGARFNGLALQDIKHRDVYAYRLLLRGQNALASGTLEESKLVGS